MLYIPLDPAQALSPETMSTPSHINLVQSWELIGLQMGGTFEKEQVGNSVSVAKDPLLTVFSSGWAWVDELELFLFFPADMVAEAVHSDCACL